MDALILADGDVSTRAALDAAWPGWDAAVGLVIASDGGARHAPALGVRIDLWVGDGDSIAAADLEILVSSGVRVERSRPDKDESDTELAIHAALKLGADGIILLGALGGPRIDHAVANIGLLAMPELAECRAWILDARSRIGCMRAPRAGGEATTRSLPGRIGDLVSLLPLGDAVEGVTSHGLRFPLVDEALPLGPARGLSNAIEATGASVSLRSGILLVIESPASWRPLLGSDHEPARCR